MRGIPLFSNVTPIFIELLGGMFALLIGVLSIYYRKKLYQNMLKSYRTFWTVMFEEKDKTKDSDNQNDFSLLSKIFFLLQ